MNRQIRHFAIAVITIALVAVACGDDDSGTAGGQDNSELISGLTARIVDDSQGDDIVFNEAQAACFATGLLDQFGSERLAAALDLEFEEFMAQASLDERRRVVDTMFGCVDFGGLLAAQFGGAVSGESATCLADAITGGDAFRDAMANSFGPDAGNPFDDPALAEAMLPVMLDCLTAEELVQLGNS